MKEANRTPDHSRDEQYDLQGAVEIQRSTQREINSSQDDAFELPVRLAPGSNEQNSVSVDFLFKRSSGRSLNHWFVKLVAQAEILFILSYNQSKARPSKSPWMRSDLGHE